MDNGKAKIYLRYGIPVIEIYHYGELHLSDVIWIHHTLFNNFAPPIQKPTDLIVDQVGSYSFSINAYECLAKLMCDTNRVAFVMHHPSQEETINLAVNTYLSEHEVMKFTSLSDAYKWMASDVQQHKSSRSIAQ